MKNNEEFEVIPAPKSMRTEDVLPRHQKNFLDPHGEKVNKKRIFNFNNKAIETFGRHQ